MAITPEVRFELYLHTVLLRGVIVVIAGILVVEISHVGSVIHISVVVVSLAAAFGTLVLAAVNSTIAARPIPTTTSRVYGREGICSGLP